MNQFDHAQSPPLSLFEISLSDVIHPLTLRLNLGSFHLDLVSDSQRGSSTSWLD
jgi:hypothetical protein